MVSDGQSWLVCSFIPAAYPLMAGNPEKLRFDSALPHSLQTSDSPIGYAHAGQRPNHHTDASELRLTRSGRPDQTGVLGIHTDYGRTSYRSSSLIWARNSGVTFSKRTTCRAASSNGFSPTPGPLL